MPRALLYLDASALVKLIVEEPESAALRAVVREWPRRVSSLIAAVELPRATRRARTDVIVERQTEELLRRLHLIPLDRTLIDRAARLEPPLLRTLDAIHLASARSLGADLGALATYDARLAEAATAEGLQVVVPR